MPLAPAYTPLKSRAELTLLGRQYTGIGAAAGMVIPIYSNTTQQFGLWNPDTSGRILEVAEIGLGSYVDTTGAAGGYVLGYLPNAPSKIGTGLAITAFTETTALNGLPNYGETSRAKFGQGATLTVTAPTLWKHLNLNQSAFTAAGTAEWPKRGTVVNYPDRDLWVPPGVAIFLAGNIATLAKFAPTITWYEHDWA